VFSAAKVRPVFVNEPLLSALRRTKSEGLHLPISFISPKSNVSPFVVEVKIWGADDEIGQNGRNAKGEIEFGLFGSVLM
jgi:hypothetical protein